MNGAEFSLPPAFDMKAFKAEILKEMRSEITKAKNEIIDGECFDLCVIFARTIRAAVIAAVTSSRERDSTERKAV